MIKTCDLSCIAKKQTAFSLIIVLILTAVFFVLVSTLLFISLKQINTLKLLEKQTIALINAESAVAHSFYFLEQDPLFFTDLAYQGSTENLKTWLIVNASGLTKELNNGSYKIVKEKDLPRVFAVGFLGDINAAEARHIIKVDYQKIDNKFIKNFTSF